MSELYHHGIKGMKWGVRRYRNKDGNLTSKGRSRLSKEERKKNGEELNRAIENSKSHRNTGRASAKEVWNNSSTMQKFYEYTKNDYKKRNEIYDGKRAVPNDVLKKYDMFTDNEARYYSYGKVFNELMKKKASEIVYDKKDVETIMKLVEKADQHPINDTYNERAWLYWH